MEQLKNVKHLMKRQLEELTSGGDINPQTLEMIGEIVDIIKDVETICAMREQSEHEGYSERYYDGRGGGYSNRMYPPMYYDDHHVDHGYYNDNETAYNGGSSYRRGRDAMGRYTSRTGGYSRAEAKEDMVQQLEHMMSQAGTEAERKAISQCIEKLEA